METMVVGYIDRDITDERLHYLSSRWQTPVKILCALAALQLLDYAP